MGQYRFMLYFVMQIGVSIELDYKYEIVLNLLFLRFQIGLLNCANGYNFFNKWIK